MSTVEFKELPDSVKSFSFDSYTQLLKFYETAVELGLVVEEVTDEDYAVEGTFIGTPSV